ncbi:MAG: ATP-binding protein, partial [Verrucomicrobiota bacterium]|nr:ATP-binding protein [Verrucomicrobiota bacterium]
MLSVDQKLGPFCALVGPNASGKTSFLDCIQFLSDLMQARGGDVQEVVQSRSSDFKNLVWLGQGRQFQLAVEATIPEKIQEKLADPKLNSTDRVKYKIDIGVDENDVLGINRETLKWVPCHGAQTAKSGKRRYLLKRESDNKCSYYSYADPRLTSRSLRIKIAR